MNRPSTPSNIGAKEVYWVHHAGQVQGPFDRDFIDAMILADVYPANVRVVKDGHSGGQNPSASKTNTSAIEPSPKPRVVTNNKDTSPSKPRQPLSRDAKWTMAVAMAGLAFMLWVIGQLAQNQPTATSTASVNSVVSPSNALASNNLSSAVPNPESGPSTNSTFQEIKPSSPELYKPLVHQEPDPVNVTSPNSEYSKNKTTHKSKAAASAEQQRESLNRIYAQSSLGRLTTNATKSAKTTLIEEPTKSDLTASLPPSEDSQLYRDESGRVYRVPNSAYYRLLSMSSALGLKKQNLDREEAELTFLAEELDRDRRYLDRSSQYEVDRFNRKVNRLNALNDELQSLVRDYNRDVNAFNAELERVGTPIR